MALRTPDSGPVSFQLSLSSSPSKIMYFTPSTKMSEISHIHLFILYSHVPSEGLLYPVVVNELLFFSAIFFAPLPLKNLVGEPPLPVLWNLSSKSEIFFSPLEEQRSLIRRILRPVDFIDPLLNSRAYLLNLWVWGSSPLFFGET